MLLARAACQRVPGPALPAPVMSCHYLAVSILLMTMLAARWPRQGTQESRMKKALITGVTGQDGSYLAEFLLEKGYCWRRFKSEPPRRLKTEPGVEAARERVGCG